MSHPEMASAAPSTDPRRRTSCLVCGSSALKSHGPTALSLRRCGGCGLVFVDPLPTAEEIAQREDAAFHGGVADHTGEMFEAYYRNYADDPVVRGFRTVVQHLAAATGGGTLVDVGIGTGLLLHLAGEAGFKPIGCEIAPDAAARAQQEFGLEVRVGDFLEADLPPGLDAITMGDVLEHTPDPRRFLERAFAALRPGGVLYVAVPNHRSTTFWAADLLMHLPGTAGLGSRVYVSNHYWYFSPANLGRLLEQVGFRVETTRQEAPYLGRYNFSPPVRAGLTLLNVLGRITGLEARAEAYARKPA